MDRSSRSSPGASSLPQGGARCHEHSEARIVSHCLCRHLALAESPSAGVTQPAVSHARLWLGVITVTPPARLRGAGESRPLPPPCSALSRGSARVRGLCRGPGAAEGAGAQPPFPAGSSRSPAERGQRSPPAAGSRRCSRSAGSGRCWHGTDRLSTRAWGQLQSTEPRGMGETHL